MANVAEDCCTSQRFGSDGEIAAQEQVYGGITGPGQVIKK
jgi:hypothetical protein